MPISINSPEVRNTLNTTRRSSAQRRLTPSPEDWRDQWIYFLMVDRFNNPSAPPKSGVFDAPYSGFQGGTIEGVRQKLDYLKDLGVGAIWLSPVLKNCQQLDGAPNEGTYHGYGVQNFLEIDPRFASDPQNAGREFRCFVDEAHAHGIYVILDIVLNHTGDVFAYEVTPERYSSDANFKWSTYPVHWRDGQGRPQTAWTDAERVPASETDAAILPEELRRNAFFRRMGNAFNGGTDETVGDFVTLKELVTEEHEAGNILIRAYEYLIAAYDIDGFRIDTLKHLDRKFALRFGNAMREFALSVGKKNFFTFGEVLDREEKISEYIGANRTTSGEMVGVDAAIDFPLFNSLPSVIKGWSAPNKVVDMYGHRKQVQKDVVSSHGEASRFFVTFLDNHDQNRRFYYSDSSDPQRFDDQLTLGVASLFALPGIPCLYYGAEQGLHGAGDKVENVREALWGKQNAFDENHPFYKAIRQLTQLRNEQPALRYGRFYFRPLSGDGVRFAVSTYPNGVLAFSRVLNVEELVVIANTSTETPFNGLVIVDSNLSGAGAQLSILYSNKTAPTAPSPVRWIDHGEIHEVEGSISPGPACAVSVSLQPMEIQILGRPHSAPVY